VWLPGLGELDHRAIYALALSLAPCEARERLLEACVQAERGRDLREQLAVGELVGVAACGPRT
jgi:hypothetical protein